MIGFEHDGIRYRLEFDRDSVFQTEQVYGISLKDLQELRMSSFPVLFQAAFIKNHPKIRKERVDELYGLLADKGELFKALAEEYLEAVNTLIAEPEEGKALAWTRG